MLKLMLVVSISCGSACNSKSEREMGKRSAGEIQLHMILTDIREYGIQHGEYPPSSVASLPGPDGSACRNSGGKIPVTQEWDSDPAWGPLRFHIDEPTRYTYHWIRVSPNKGYATAVCDLDCNGKLSITRLDVSGPRSGAVDNIVQGVPSPE